MLCFLSVSFPLYTIGRPLFVTGAPNMVELVPGELHTARPHKSLALMLRCTRIYLFIHSSETDASGQSLCPTASEIVTSACISNCQNRDYMMLQMIGAPDWYPNYGDSARTWSPSTADNPNGEFVELKFPFPLYISQVDIYETNKGQQHKK